MRPRVLKLGTRRSALARAQSAAVAMALERLHPGLEVELVGIETRGDRIQDRPLSAVDGKEFFTAEIDRALLEGQVDFTVHSYKDLSLERTSRLWLAAVPRREHPGDIAIFARDVPQRLLEGAEVRIGTSSPRRVSFVPDFLRWALPRPAPGSQPMSVRQVDLRGNVDSRLRRLHEPRGSERQLDGVVLAFAGLARLWADQTGRELLMRLFAPLPRMILPLSACPAAPAQGALAIECRAEDAATRQLLATIDDLPTRRAVEVERALLAERGGGCHQRFGATQVELPELGTLLYVREDGIAPQLRWSPAAPLPAPAGTVRAWDGARAERAASEPIAAVIAEARQRLPAAKAVFVAHTRALADGLEQAVSQAAHLYVPGVSSWQALAARGLWVEGCSEGLGIGALEPLLHEPLLQLPALSEWTVLTHSGAVAGWTQGQAIATYRHAGSPPAPPADATHLYWHSSAQFDRWQECCAALAQHACGPGKTFQHLRRAGVQNLRMFPSVTQWREWLGL